MPHHLSNQIAQVGTARRAVRRTVATTVRPFLVRETCSAQDSHRKSPESPPLSKSAAESPKGRGTTREICRVDSHRRSPVHIGQACRKGGRS